MKELKVETIKKRLIKNLKANGIEILPEPLATNHFIDNDVISVIITIDTFAEKLIESNIKYINILTLEPLGYVTYTDKYILRCKLYTNS